MKIHGTVAVGLVCLGLGACDQGKGGEPKAAQPAAATAAAQPAAAQPAPAPAPAKAEVKGTSYGAGVKLADATPIDSILADPNAFKGKSVRVEGMITDVCPKRGCWFEMAGNGPGKKLRFKVTDGEMVFPMESKGKRVVAEGVVAVSELSIEESKQFAEYQSKEYGIPYDPASITKPMSVVRLDGTGAVFAN